MAKYKKYTKKKKKSKSRTQKRKPVSRNKGLRINDSDLAFLYGPSVKELINSLDNQNNQSFNENDENFKIEFPSKITRRNFDKYFTQAIISAKQKYKKKNLKILKQLLLLLIDFNPINYGDYFGLDSNITELHKIFKIDLIFTLLTDEKKVEAYGNDLSKIDFQFKSSDDYLIWMNNKGFNEANLYDRSFTGYFSFQNFEQILFSPIILNAYKSALNELYGINISTSRIKNTLNSFISSHEIYFISIPDSYYGLTLIDGTILLNKRYVEFHNSVNGLKIVMTLFHEYMHVLSRLFRGDNNYLLNTREFLNTRGIMVTESGNYFDEKILDYFTIKEATYLEADYLLKPENYNHNAVDQFKGDFISFRNKNVKIIKSSIKFSIAKKKLGENSIFVGNHCYFAGSRFY